MGPLHDQEQIARYAARWSQDFGATVRLPHGIDRIEALGTDALVVGASGRAFCLLPRSTLVNVRWSPLGTSAGTPLRASRAATGSSIAPRSRTPDSLVCRSARRPAWLSASLRGVGVGPVSAQRLVAIRRGRLGDVAPGDSRTIGAARRAWTGMATRGRCSSGVGSSRCSVTRSLKEHSPAAASRRRAGSVFPQSGTSDHR